MKTFDTNDIKLLAIIPLAILALQLVITAGNVQERELTDINHRSPAIASVNQ